nr:amino acid adenylation domain-containing protein [Nostoc sp. DedSLP05]MDZ8097380.1 amino acid adenylation domain-containing protein [Nostoc sp. DedSLP01]
MITEELPLSYAQQRLWFLDQFEPNSAVYNIPVALRLVGNLNRAALEQSLIEIIHRHEALRTNFITVDGKPIQVIHTQTNWTVSVLEWQHLAPSEQEIATQQLAEQQAIQPFDLAKEALIRATLVVLNQTEHILLVCMHHVVSDGWSMGVFIRELAALYNAYSQGQPSPLAPLPIQYADFAIWQREWLQGDVLQTQLMYWQQQLKDAPALLSLPTDRPRPAVQTFAGANQEFALSVDLTRKLTKLSQQQGCTLFMTLLAAYNTLLYRYTGQTDILVGSPIANREHSEIEGLIGFFVNTLVMRTDLLGNPSFTELLGRVREMAMDAYAHQELPFEMLVEALQPERNLSHPPLFQVMFVLQNAPTSGVEIADLTINSLPTQNKTAKFDLTLLMYNSPAGLAGVWEYNTDLFDASTIERMAVHFQTLLEGIVANPEERISQLPLLTQVEQQQLLVEWNDTQVDYPFDKCIHQLFEQQVEKTPQSVAVVFKDQSLSYRELNERANQLAHHLQRLGVGPEVLVGVCVERCVEMVVGLLGILKAGGAYVPLDPEYPPERLAYMLEDSQVKVLLTQEKLVTLLAQSQAQQVCLDTNWSDISQASTENPDSKVLPQHLAYVIYTSGSTGKPKGAMNTHQGVCNRLLWMQQAYQITPDDSILQKTPFSFDVSVWEFFLPLITGARLVVAQPGEHRDSANLVKLIAQQQITTLHFVPSMLQVFLEEQTLESCTSLRQVFCSGEALPKELVERFFARIGCSLHNLYGPTEAAIDVTYWQCQPNSELLTVPIGRPIANTQIYILDENLQPVPLGVTGELYIGGVGVARGYFNRPELTQEKFIPNPFAGKGSERLYKTGDLARYLTDGNIEYLGRTDNQVKIRGFRIELGEIEAVLSQYSYIQASCVIAREDIPGNKSLVAYIVSQKERTPSVAELRSFLKQKLPEYMVPNTFVLLESLPLTSNGKVDRRALPKPELDSTLLEKFVAPRTPVEEMLAQIWAEVLKLNQVGIHDNFFELGGDSILSIQIISRAKQKGLQLTLKQLFGYQTIAELATVADTIKTIEVEQGLVTGTLPLTPIQHWFFEQNLQQPHHYNQSFLLSVPSDLKPELLKQALQQLLVHHDALRLRFTQSDFIWEQIHSAVTDTVAFSNIDLSPLVEIEQQAAIEAKANSLQASLNLCENLVQIAFFYLGIDKRARLLIVIHHLVVDGVSWRILLEDLQTAYQQLAQGQAITLPAKTTSFKDWSNKITVYSQSETLKEEVAYWLNESRFAVPPIPVDRTQGANTVASVNTISVSLNEVETRALLQDVPKAYNTQINDVLLTALVLVLAKWTNSKSVLFNLEGHGREDIVDGVDLSRTIGWFTTIFPVLVELQPTENLADALKSVKEQLRAIPNKGIGYGLLRYLSQDAEIAIQLKALPPAEISFNYLGQFDQLLNTSSWMQPASESAGNSHGLQNNRAHLLDINSIVSGERLQISWTYSTNIHDHATIENLAQEFVLTLQRLIAHCSLPESEGYTPSDFPLAKLNQLELDQLLASLVLKNQSGKTKSRNIEDIYPLSGMQEGILFESLYAPDSGVYFEQFSYTLSGQLNVAAFEQAWQQVVAKHSILRTAFVWEDLAQPVQVVYRCVDIELQRYDWQHLSPQQQQQQLEQLLHSQQQQGFQLSIPPLMQLVLIQLGVDNYQFIWNHHHLLLDGWSMPLVFKDLLQFYQAIVAGESFTVQPTQSYHNYIAWLQRQDLTQAQEFWRHKLQGFIAPTPLVVDKPSSKGKQLSSSYTSQQIDLTAQATAALQSFARAQQLTMNNLVQASWALLLCRYNQQDDVVFGATVSGRPPELTDIESMVGVFINTLPVRVQVGAHTEVLDLLKDLQAQQLECDRYSYSSLVDIQAHSDVNPGQPLFESIIVFENYPVDEALRDGNYSFSLENFQTFEQTNYPLTVIAAAGEQLFVKMIYDTSRFDRAAITRMLGHFQTLLEGIIADPQQKIWQVPLLRAQEKQQLLVEWNDTGVDYPFDKCIHSLFEQQVQRTPDAVAVVFENQQLTYEQLNTSANQLAHYLQSLGVKPDVLVGICVERSLEMVVGLLGILKAGGAYVPLDPEYPAQRLSFMLEDAAVGVLLTQQSLLDKLPPLQTKLVCLDAEAEQISHYSQENLVSSVQPTNLAYVIYTSGSTGLPKGVEIVHRGVTRLVFGANYVHLDATQTFLQMAPISFDASTFEIWGALLHGAKCVVFSGSIPTAKNLTNEIHKHGITTLWLTSALFNSIIDDDAQALSGIRQLLIGGEALSVTHVRKVLEHLAETQIINGYGPTESTTFTCCYPIPRQIEATIRSIPVGRPIPNTQVYILDRYLQAVPVGVPGELYIAGVALARGYLNQPELTQQRFIPNPFSTDPYSRLYKTGDLARYLPDGNIEYLGRIDNQVKIRGFRIELGEIETVLSQHKDVQASVVIVREDTPNDKRLVAYALAQHQDCTPALGGELRQFLKAKLPDYMIPSAFVMLESMPLTPNGKIDRRALKALSNISNLDTFVQPRNTLELQLTHIWSKILKLENVGVKDNFFDLGGHSLLVPYLMAQIRQQFGKEIPLVTLFHNPTIEELANVMQKDAGISSWSPLVPLQPKGANPPLFCLSGSGGNPFYLYPLACCLGSDQPFYTFQVNHLDTEVAPIARIEDIASHYIQALQVVQPQGPYFFAGHSFGGRVAYEMAQQLIHQGQEIALIVIIDTSAPSTQAHSPEEDDAAWLIAIAKGMKTLYSKDLDMDTDVFASLDPDEQVKYVVNYLKMLDILPVDADTTYLKHFLQTLRSDAKALFEYLPQQVHPIPITLLRASELQIKEPNAGEVVNQPELLQDSALGWNKYSSEPVDVQFVPGDHFTMMTQPHVQILADRLRDCIKQSQAETIS